MIERTSRSLKKGSLLAALLSCHLSPMHTNQELRRPPCSIRVTARWRAGIVHDKPKSRHYWPTPQGRRSSGRLLIGPDSTNGPFERGQKLPTKVGDLPTVFIALDKSVTQDVELLRRTSGQAIRSLDPIGSACHQDSDIVC